MLERSPHEPNEPELAAPHDAAPTSPVEADRISSADSILIVQYQLPVRLYQRPAEPDNAATGIVWAAEWDEEALLGPKGPVPAGATSGLSAARLKWIGTPPCAVS
jgi:hypothetical protein